MIFVTNLISNICCYQLNNYNIDYNLKMRRIAIILISSLFSVVPAQIRSLVGEAEKGRWLGGMVAVGAGKCQIGTKDTVNLITKTVQCL